ncbi:hypothetical protein WISP_104309 [Willisornis vidua]|uniref:Uncharacterized protein n=1 Tax=Willisornis vidua TaxID=1566151 RepID=A0ABQ9CXG0_9PASS|nr:hypothetical protein WISP_104309 [Willisornis vidua]
MSVARNELVNYWLCFSSHYIILGLGLDMRSDRANARDSEMDPPLAKAKPSSDGGSAFGITDVRRGGKKLGSCSRREEDQSRRWGRLAAHGGVHGPGPTYHTQGDTGIVQTEMVLLTIFKGGRVSLRIHLQKGRDNVISFGGSDSYLF